MELQQEVQAILDRGVSDSDVVGAVAQVVTADSVLAAAAAGKRSADTDEGAGSMTLDTVCWIASMTKPITATAAMQLVERGELHLDAPASETLPALAEVGVLEGFDEDGQPQVRPARTPVTLRHLLTHTAGFGYEFWSEEILRYQQATGAPSIISREMAALNVPALFDPGEGWMYGTSIDHVGRMVEEVSGLQLSDYFEEHILGPLGMDSTGFDLDNDRLARQSAMHARQPDGSLVVIELGAPENPQFQMGGGGLWGTVEDYGRFVQMILGHGSRNGAQVLRSDTVQQMIVNNMGDLRVVPLRSALAHLTNDAEFFVGVEKSWGLSFQINEEPVPTGRPAGALMWAGLANSYFWIDVANSVSGIYISQLLPFADARSYQLFEDIETATYKTLS